MENLKTGQFTKNLSYYGSATESIALFDFLTEFW